MPSTQQWLENNYPNKENTTKIKFDSDNLELNQGELTIANYPNLEEIYKLEGRDLENITKVTIRNCPKLKEVNIHNFTDNQQLEIRECDSLEILKCGNNQLTSLDLSNFQGLKTLYCYKNKLTKLDLTNLEKLEILDCWENQLTKLDLSQNKLLTEIGCSQNKLAQLTLPNKLDNLQELHCHTNELTSLDFLNSLNPQKLVELILNDNNFPPQDLKIFVSFGELKDLRINGINKPSYFMGSLKPLQELKKLEILNIGGTDITHGLEYLPESVKDFDCTPNRPNAKVIDIYEELQPFGSDINKWRAVKLEKQPYLLTAPLMPSQLRDKESEINKLSVKDKEKLTKKLESDEELAELFNKLSLEPTKSQPEPNWTLKPNYTSLHFNHWKLTNPSLPHETPLRLYDFKEDVIYYNEVEKTNNKNQEPTKNLQQPYAILSYVWGDRDSQAMQNSSVKSGNKTVSNSASKAIGKGIGALEVINQELKDQRINYLWVDQLCMNQEDQHEKSTEVPKMGRYYDNSALTLIDMNSKLGEIKEIDLMEMLKIIVNSEWFQRSWTYQEGWLSKHTVFMFDDLLVDGRAMAGVWALNQVSYVEGGKYLSRSEFDRGTKKIATPVGWTYYRDGYDATTDKVELTLTQALYAIKNRKRTEPLDGIYSILGLLPYGKKVRVSYSENNTPEQALVEVMKVAIKNGYAEPLSWHGESNLKDGLCCLPQISEWGSTSVMGSVGKINSIFKEVDGTTHEIITLTDQGIDFTWSTPHYLIYKTNQNTHKLESGFEIEGGLFRKEITVKPKGMEEEIKVSLLGTKETLEVAEQGNLLVVFYKEHYGTNKLFALLVKESDEYYDTYHRLGLVELANSEGIKFILGNQNFKKETLIGSTPQFHSQIQIPPKN